MEKKTQIKCGWLIDGLGGQVQENVTLTINGDRIEKIDQDATLPSLVDTYIDLSHCTITPPLADSLVYLFMSATTDKTVRETQLQSSCTELGPAIKRHLNDLFSYGILGFRDGGDHGGCSRQFCQSADLHPELTAQCAGKALHKKGQYGAYFGRAVASNTNLATLFDSSFADSDVVRVFNSGLNSLQELGKETEPQFSTEELRELVAVAEEKNQKVTVHANGPEAVHRAIAAGCQSIEHGFFMGEDNLKRLADSGIFWVPTVFTIKAFGLFRRFIRQQSDAGVIQKTLENQLNQLRLAKELGVKVALGTAAGSLGVLHGEAMVEELKLFKKAGYTLSEAIQCATTRSAALLGLKQFQGISAGKAATFLICRGAPSQLPRKLLYLESMWINGKPSPYYRKNPVKHVAQ